MKLALRKTRGVIAAMETRAGICSYKASGEVTLTVPGQGAARWAALRDPRRHTGHGAHPHGQRCRLVRDEGPIYPGYACLAHATYALRRPVKWTDERSRAFSPTITVR